jgi:hypothetical protein
MTAKHFHLLAMATAVLAAGLTTACQEKVSVMPGPANSAGIDSRSQVNGVAPASPGSETTATAPAVKSDIGKAQQSTAMPLPGQANDHSTPAPKATQKSNAGGS